MEDIIKLTVWFLFFITIWMILFVGDPDLLDIWIRNVGRR